MPLADCTDNASRTEAARSESPFVGSDNGMQSDDTNPSPAKGKTKTKGKRAGERYSEVVLLASSRIFDIADDADFNLKRKRVGFLPIPKCRIMTDIKQMDLPQTSPTNKKQKKQKTSGGFHRSSVNNELSLT